MKYSNLDFNNKNVLITGGAGFIGSNIAIYLQKHFPKCNIVVFDLFRSGKKFNNGNLISFGHYNNLIDFKGKIISGDVNSKYDLSQIENCKFDYIFHQAAVSDTRADEQDYIIKTNVNSFYEILKISVQSNARLIYASSAATYGNCPSPQTVGIESPENTYGFSKLMMDNVAQDFISKNPEFHIVGLRYFNVYGPREFYKNTTASTIIQFGHQILSGNNPKLFENSDEIFRDFIYVKDVVQANIKACSCNKSGIYNVGTGVKRSFQEVSDILQKTFKTQYKTEYFKNPYHGYQSDTCANILETKEKLGFQPYWSLEKGILDYSKEILSIHEKYFKK